MLKLLFCLCEHVFKFMHERVRFALEYVTIISTRLTNWTIPSKKSKVKSKTLNHLKCTLDHPGTFVLSIYTAKITNSSLLLDISLMKEKKRTIFVKHTKHERKFIGWRSSLPPFLLKYEQHHLCRGDVISYQMLHYNSACP